MENRSEEIANAVYRMIKGYGLTLEQEILVREWLQEEKNLQIVRNLTNDEWIGQARKKYYALGKEAGLQKLRDALLPQKNNRQRLFNIARRFINSRRVRWLFFWLFFVAIGAIIAYLFF